MAGKKPPADVTADVTGNPPPDAGGGVAVLDPPDVVMASDDEMPPSDVESEPMALTATDGLVKLAGQEVQYLVDQDGKVRGADVHMWKHALDFKSVQTYNARIRHEDGQFYWYEPEAESSHGWKRVKRGQDTQRLQPIVEQAIEYALNRVFGNSWIT